MDPERALVEAFVRRPKRDRLLTLLDTAKRDQLLDGLYHFADFDSRFLEAVAPIDQTASKIASLLRDRGAPPVCHVLSTDRALDGREMPLVEALELLVGQGEGSILSCVPGRLAYFEGEDPGDRWILQRAAS